MRHLDAVRIGITAGLLALTFATSAPAATLPSPPWYGFVPPNGDAAKAAASTSDLFSRFGERHAKCDAKAVKGLAAAVTDPETLGKLDADWVLCLAEADAYFLEKRGKLIADGRVPTCVSPAMLNSLADQVKMTLDPISPAIFCDGPPAADSATGLNVPTDPAFAKGEIGVSEAISKLRASTRKCLNKGALVAVKLGDPSAALSSTNECLAKVTLKTDAIFDKLSVRGQLPPCLPVTQAQVLAQLMQAWAQTFDGSIYCASPSAAFLDGGATF